MESRQTRRMRLAYGPEKTVTLEPVEPTPRQERQQQSVKYVRSRTRYEAHGLRDKERAEKKRAEELGEEDLIQELNSALEEMRKWYERETVEELLEKVRNSPYKRMNRF